MKGKQIGSVVKINNKPTGTWSKMYIGMTGVIESKCGLYKNAFVVRFENGFCASFYKREMETK